MHRTLAVFVLMTLRAWSQQQPGSISGLVVDASGSPVSDVRLRLTDGQSTGSGTETNSQPDGAFRFAPLPPGRYYLYFEQFQNPGPLGGPQTGIRVEVKTGRETAGLRLTLAPPTAASGRILDDDGQPVVGCQVFLFPAGPQEYGWNRINMAITNDRGNFRFEGIPPDRYVAYAHCMDILPTEHLLDVVPSEGFETKATWLPLYYAGSPTRTGAQEFSAAPGLDPRLEIHLQAASVSTITGQLTAAPGVAWQNPLSIELHPPTPEEDTRYSHINGLLDHKTGRFTIRAVPPGSYRLIANTSDRNSTTPGSATFPITVGNIAPNPFPIVLRPGVAVTGVVENGPGVPAMQPIFQTRTEHTPSGPVTRREKLPAGHIILESIDAPSSLYVAPAEIDSETGAFAFPAVPPGLWRVRCGLNVNSSYVESLQFNDKLAPDGVVEILPGRAAALRFRMAAKPDLDLHLDNVPTDNQCNWMVLAVPETPPLTQLGEFVTIAKPGSVLGFRALPPGRYRLLALELDFAASRDRAPLLPLLSRDIDPVEVSATGNQSLPVRCFSAAEVETIVRTYLYGDNPPPTAP
ncbi:carboxypeptidase-like regulatory domain-containing protein [uncultured Paludibaculum sp.]|uniref:carboxypeptidase-like regulatory domain-containing protein n=1 Tax=uncultured Paludibaculum sp. TaxID=1765020 RepID=UPI002AAAA55D|nr:carboxypeptidase-like regulatory domain-containing protein [uncultured Paludibaculum sp.]